MTDGKGWDWIFSLDKNTNTFYVPVVDDMELLDQYDLYRFNGNYFIYSGREGGYWLHPSIRKFNRLEKLVKIGKFLVRIDKVTADTYRYTSWSNTEDMSQKPDITIENGNYNKSKDEYRFINGNYTYCIKVKEEGTELVIKQYNKIVCVWLGKLRF